MILPHYHQKKFSRRQSYIKKKKRKNSLFRTNQAEQQIKEVVQPFKIAKTRKAKQLS